MSTKDEVLWVKEDKKVLHTIKGRKANWIGHILRRNCRLEHVTKGKIEGMERRGRRREELLDDLKETGRMCDEKVLERERGSIIKHCLEKSLWKRL